jgi:hypothetical protein
VTVGNKFFLVYTAMMIYDVNVANNLISVAAKKQKAEQAMCQLAECIAIPVADTSHQPCVGGN